MKSYLFVCTGNICRSITADAMLKATLKEKGLEAYCESAGTHGYHIGEKADYRAIETASKHGLDMNDLRARQLQPEDFEKFDVLLAMDKGHERAMRRIADDAYHDKIKLFLDYHPDYEGCDVPDPYYADMRAFEKMYTLIEKGIQAMVEKEF